MSDLEDRLALVMRLYLDANIIIYFIEGCGVEHERTRAIIAAAVAQNIRLVSSELSIAECLHGPLRQGQEDVAALFRSFFLDGDVIELVPAIPEVLEIAARIGSRHKFRLADSIHVASAMMANCDAFITNDKKLKCSPELDIIRLFEV